jgi:hypothetical protein
MIYTRKQKFKRSFGVFLESRKSKGHFEVFFVSWGQNSRFGGFFWKFETFFEGCPKTFPQKKVETFFLFFLGFDPKIVSIKMIYIRKQKFKRSFGVFLESRKSKGHFRVIFCLMRTKQSFWEIFLKIWNFFWGLPKNISSKKSWDLFFVFF